MDRFVAFMWDPQLLEAPKNIESATQAIHRRSPLWRLALERSGLRVLVYAHRGPDPIVTQMDGGIIVGSLFARGREQNGRVRRLDPAASKRIAATYGEYLISEYWGNYVALWHSLDGKSFVLRDPCGAVPCFRRHLDGALLLFSHADDVADFVGPLSINWDALKAFVVFDYFVTEHTGFNEISELLPGQRLTWRSGHLDSYHWCWNAAHLAASPSLVSFESAALDLRTTMEACFCAWGTEYPRIVASVSGGLDSSILLGLLRRVTPSHVTGLHYVGVDYERFEVALAREACARAGVRLVEGVHDPKNDDVTRIMRAPKMVRPRVQTFAVLIDDLSTQLADEVSANCFMIGQGGDNLFLQRSGAKFTAADHLLLRGLGASFLSCAYDNAILQQTSVWRVLTLTRSALIHRKTWKPYAFLHGPHWTKNRPLATEMVASIPISHMEHPWLSDAWRLPPGKAEHLLSIVGLYRYYVDHWRGIERDVIYPIFSQPVLELALQTPTFVLAQGGTDRALERAAFRDILPPSIYKRTNKGGANQYLVEMMKLNLRFLRELILDGAIARQGWLDRKATEQMLTEEFLAHGGGRIFLLLLASAEAWLAAWSGLATSTASRS